MPEKRHFPLFAILLVIAIVASAFIVFTLVGIIFNVSTNDKENDIRNWVSLTIESGIGIFIAMMVLYYDKLQQKKNETQQKDIENLAKEIKGITERQQKIIENTQNIIIGQKTRSFTIILGNLNSCKQFLFMISERSKPKPDVHRVGFLTHEISVFHQVFTNSLDYISQEAEFLRPHIPVDLYSEIKEVEQKIRGLTKPEGILVPLIPESANTWFALAEEAFNRLEKLIEKIKNQPSNKS